MSPGSEVLQVETGGGGGVVAGGAVEGQVSVGGAIAGGVSSSGVVEVKGGYTGRLYGVVEFGVTVVPEVIPEEGTAVLTVEAVMDDGSRVDGGVGGMGGLFWEPLAGPVVTIDQEGVLTADTVYEDTEALIEGRWLGGVDRVQVTIAETVADNFGLYAGDGIDDIWQVGFFGVGNVDGLAEVDFDGDGQNNLYEFLALVDPTDPLSLLHFELVDAGVVRFLPVRDGRFYTVLAGDMSGELAPLSGAEVSEEQGERTVRDTESTAGGRRFYQLKISNEP